MRIVKKLGGPRETAKRIKKLGGLGKVAKDHTSRDDVTDMLESLASELLGVAEIQENCF